MASASCDASVSKGTAADVDETSLMVGVVVDSGDDVSAR